MAKKAKPKQRPRSRAKKAASGVGKTILALQNFWQSMSKKQKPKLRYRHVTRKQKPKPHSRFMAKKLKPQPETEAEATVQGQEIETVAKKAKPKLQPETVAEPVPEQVAEAAEQVREQTETIVKKQKPKLQPEADIPAREPETETTAKKQKPKQQPETEAEATSQEIETVAKKAKPKLQPEADIPVREPETETTAKKADQKPPALSDRVKTGVAGLDELVAGGLERNNSIVIKGASGVGKTIFALQYLWYGATKCNEPGMYLSFAESREAIFKRGMLFGWDFEKLEKEKKFVFARYEPHEIKDIITAGGGSIRDMIESTGTERLVIDSLSAYFLLFDTEYEANRSVLELFEMLHGLNCTTLVTSEDPLTPSSAPQGRMGFLTDGIIHLYNLRRGIRRTRAIEIVKMRNTNHTTELCSFNITKKGIAIRRGFCWRKEDDYGDRHQSNF